MDHNRTLLKPPKPHSCKIHTPHPDIPDPRGSFWLMPRHPRTQVFLSLRSMLASATEKKRPTGDAEYTARVGSRSPKLSKWVFEDDKV